MKFYDVVIVGFVLYVRYETLLNVWRAGGSLSQFCSDRALNEYELDAVMPWRAMTSDGLLGEALAEDNHLYIYAGPALVFERP